jgi:calcineurin-like phosphoesterase family protein
VQGIRAFERRLRDLMQKFYIADPHFGHEAVIRLSNRPFKSVEEMDNAIINNWNWSVKSEDDVYILGDFLCRSQKPPQYYLKKLKGKKHLILGNHDNWTRSLELSHYFQSVSQIKEISDMSHHIVLCHYPIAEWPRYHRGSLHVFGHIHNHKDSEVYQYYLKHLNMLNAGVDINHYTPVSLTQLMVNNRAFKEL